MLTSGEMIPELIPPEYYSNKLYLGIWLCRFVANRPSPELWTKIDKETYDLLKAQVDATYFPKKGKGK